MSKSRFNQIRQVLVDKLGGDNALVGDIVTSIQNIMQFDPTASTYNEAHGAKVKEWRQRKAEETGQTLYVVAGVQKSYQRKRAAVAAARAGGADVCVREARPE